MRYSPRGPIPKDQVKEVTQETLQFFIKHWQQHGFGVWSVVEKATVKLIGHCGLNFLPNSPEVEVLYQTEFRSQEPEWANRPATANRIEF